MLSHMLRVPLASGGGYPDIASSVKTTSGSAASSLAVTMPSGIVAGDLLLVILYATSTGTWTGPGGWTSLAGAQGCSIFYRIATGSETSTYTFTSPATSQLLASALRISGSHATSPPEAQTTSSSTGTTAADPPSLTPSWGSAANLWLVVLSSAQTAYLMGTPTFPANYTYQQTSANMGAFTAGCHFFAGRKLTATSDDPGAFTSYNTNRYLVATIAIRPA